MPILRVLIDEFGCGNLNQAHSQLYTDLLSELDMPTNIESYLDDLNQESYAFLNIFYWLTQRASNIEYFLGALAYLESMIPFTFKCFAEACQRLGILNSKYYTEHIHIDGFHSKDALRAIKEVELAANLCYSKVWIGVKIASLITNQAFDAAILKSKKAPNVLINSAKNSDFIAETEPDLTINHKETFSIELKDKQIRIQGDCPHRAGKLRAGIINVDNGTITCPLHFSKFNIETGKLISGPACSSLHVCNVTDRSNL
jgi:nitrite reductase/ring-hydroxylating ferredoxin subunit